jgi:hypothetical protein
MQFRKSKTGQVLITFPNLNGVLQVLPLLLENKVSYELTYPKEGGVLITVLSGLTGALGETIKSLETVKVCKWKESIYPFGEWVEDNEIPHQMLSDSDIPLAFYRGGWLFKKKADRPFIYCLEYNRGVRELDNPNLICYKLAGLDTVIKSFKSNMDGIEKKLILLSSYPPSYNKDEGVITLNPHYPNVLLGNEESQLETALRLWLFSNEGIKLTKVLPRLDNTQWIVSI